MVLGEVHQTWYRLEWKPHDSSKQKIKVLLMRNMFGCSEANLLNSEGTSSKRFSFYCVKTVV